MAEDINKVQSVPIQGVDKSVFDGSFTHKHTQKIADVVPNACVPIFPGDKFKGSVATAFNFPPLVAPAYQGFTQKAYMFRVRKGLVWHNDGIRNALNCLKDGSNLNYPEPHVALSSGYYFGSNKYCIRFHPHIPVYGHIGENGECLLHKHCTNPNGYSIPELSVNAFLQNHMDAFLNWWTKDNVKSFFSPFVADAVTHGYNTSHPLEFAPVLDYHTHYHYEKGHSIGSRYGFNAYADGWNRSNPDGNPSNGTKADDPNNVYRTSMFMTFFPFRDNFGDAFMGFSSGDIQNDIIVNKKASQYRIQDDLVNPYCSYQFAIGYVSDGVGGPSSLMEYLGLPSMNHNGFHAELEKNVYQPWLDLCFSSQSNLIKDVYALEKVYDAMEISEDFTVADANYDFNSDMALILDTYGSVNKVAWDVKLKYGHQFGISTTNYLNHGLPLFDSVSQGFDPTNDQGSTRWFDSTLYDYMQQYAIWCIEHGYGDGTIPNDEDVPPIYIRNLANIFIAPMVDHSATASVNADYPCQSLCPWLAYWHVYENYFRDANISESLKPVLQYFQTSSASRSLSGAHNVIVRSDSTDFVTWFGKDYSTFGSDHQLTARFKLPMGNFLLWMYDQLEYFGISGIPHYTASDGSVRLMHPGTYTMDNVLLSHVSDNLQRWIFRLECHHELMYPFRKLLDKDLFTNMLPTTSKVEVFAPSFSSSDLATLYDGKEMFVALDEELSHAEANSTSARPIPLASAPNVANYIDVDALRTAQILQRYYRDASLVGDQINQFIRMTFGERSQDFRPEVPELVFAREFPCHISELTQQSETSELPIGSEAGKLQSSSSAIKFDISANGDFGYFIYLTCIYPETTNFNGLNHQFDVHYNQFEQLFVPRFSTLGEEALTSLQVDCLPKAKCDYRGANAITKADTVADSSRVVGFVPRYALFKRIPSYVSGRFKGDMNYWTLDRIPNPFDARMSLTHKYLETPRDLRLFASDEEENCYGFTAFRMSFVRGVATDNYQPVI